MTFLDYTFYETIGTDSKCKWPSSKRVEMKRPLELTAAIAIKEAAGCLSDAQEICRQLKDHRTERQLCDLSEKLEPIFDDMNARSRAAHRS